MDERYRTIPDRDHRGIQGKSSGGYGALVTPMLRPDVFSALASHAGDALFEACYLPEFRETVRALRDQYEGSFDRFWEDFRSRPAFSKKEDGVLLNVWCMAACYSTDDDGTVRLPFDVATGKQIDDVWQRWLDKDPVRLIPRHADEMRSMRAIWVDGGTKDEWFLDNGAVAVSQGARGDRRRPHARAVRRRSHGDRLSLSQVAGVPVGRPCHSGLNCRYGRMDEQPAEKGSP